MRCNASKLELELMPDHRVIITLRCDTAYEAAVLFEDISETSQKGGVSLEFEVGKRTVVIDRTK